MSGVTPAVSSTSSASLARRDSKDPMKACIVLLFAVAAFAADTIDAFGQKWTVPQASDWTVEQEDGKPVLRLLVPNTKQQPRRPVQFALADTAPWQQVTLECDVKRNGGSLILVYAYRDETHFNY